MITMTILHGEQVWRNETGQYHREDGPAVIWADGTQVWYINGRPHREDGPAHDSKEVLVWWTNGNCHRMDGPAYIHSNGKEEWWINDFEVTHAVGIWLKENNFPDWKKWTDSHKIMFYLAFVGTNKDQAE